jgi:hypothetical protein
VWESQLPGGHPETLDVLEQKDPFGHVTGEDEPITQTDPSKQGSATVELGQ